MNIQGNILVLTPWSFKDALIETYTLPYLNIIREILPAKFKIILVTEEQIPIALSDTEKEEINRHWSAQNMHLVALPYKHFGWKKMFAWVRQVFHLRTLMRKQKISVIHAFCTPSGSVGYLLSRLTGRPLIIDSYEPHAESMVENGTWKKSGIAYRILFHLEKLQTKRALHLIAAASGMQEYAKKKYGITINSFFVKPACVDLDKFRPGIKNEHLINELGLNNRIVGFYAGKIGGIYLKEEVFDFIKVCYEFWGESFRFLMLTNTPQQEIAEQIKRVNLPADIIIRRFVFHGEVPQYMSLGDFAINPVKPVPSKRYCTSIKDGEYWAMGLPVVISPGISDDSGIIEKEYAGVVMDFYKKEEFNKALRMLETLIGEKQATQARIREIAEKNRSFVIAREIYQHIYGTS